MPNTQWIFLVHSVSVLYLGATCAHGLVSRAHTHAPQKEERRFKPHYYSCGKGQYMSSNAKHSSGGRYSISSAKPGRMESGEGPCRRTIEGHNDYVLGVAFSPDGQYLASGSFDKTMKLWSTPCRETPLQTMERVYALLSSLKHNNSAPHRNVYQLGQYGGGPFPIIQSMVEWWDPEWFV